MKKLLAGVVAFYAVGLTALAASAVRSSEASLAWLDTRYPIIEQLSIERFNTLPGGTLLIIR